MQNFFVAITNPKVPPNSSESVKRFNFDYSYWSHDVSFFFVFYMYSKNFLKSKFILHIFCYCSSPKIHASPHRLWSTKT